MTDNLQKLYGPLTPLIGTWEGIKGHDTAPDDNRKTEINLFRERMVFEAIGMVNNHEQTLFALRYKTIAWRIDEQDPFHEELGYWLWDNDNKQVMRCFMIPRGVTVIAGGKVQPSARKFTLKAELGSKTFGICSNPFLHAEFRTVAYDLVIEFISENSFSYRENTKLKIKNQKKIFNHIDKNTLSRV